MFNVQRSKQVHELAERYRLFARTEAAGRSPLYERLSIHVSQSPAALAFLSTLPPDKQQPKLFIAAIRLIAGTPLSTVAFEESLAKHIAAIRQVMAPCKSTGTVPPPSDCPNIVWRAGLDLNPIDLRNTDDVA